jgi:glycosyltransferase involved in cell wall biosynthesis
MVRILTITSWYPPHHYGGYELSCYDVMTRLATHGHTIRVLCGDERVQDAARPDPSHEQLVHRDLRAHWHEGSDWRPTWRESIAIERRNREVLERHIAEFRPDVVSVWHMVAISASLLQHLARYDIPVVNVVCDDWPVYLERVDAWTARFNGGAARQWTGRLVEAATRMPTTAGNFTESGVFCFVSDTTKRRVFAGRRGTYPVSTVVYSGIERSYFPRRVDDGRQPNGWRLLYVGRLDATKGVETLLRAFAELPDDATLACYGRGGEQERVRLGAICTALGIASRVTFGSLERDELAAMYSSADIVAFPSEWPEPFGLVPLEAMACGTPVVASGVGGSAEFLRDGYNCVLFERGDATALAAAVRRLHDDAELRESVVCGGFTTVAQLGVDELADTLEAWHVGAAGGFRDGRPPERTLALQPRAAAADDVPRATFARAGLPAIGLFTERRARGTAPTCAVVATVDALPFRTGSIEHLSGVDVLERAADAHIAVREIARVLRPEGTAELTAPNRNDAMLVWARLRDRWSGLRRPARAYVHSSDNRREYSGPELAALLGAIGRVRARRAVTWEGGPKRHALSTAVRAARLRSLSAGFVIDVERDVRL